MFFYFVSIIIIYYFRAISVSFAFLLTNGPDIGSIIFLFDYLKINTKKGINSFTKSVAGTIDIHILVNDGLLSLIFNKIVIKKFLLMVFFIRFIVLVVNLIYIKNYLYDFLLLA